MCGEKFMLLKVALSLSPVLRTEALDSLRRWTGSNRVVKTSADLQHVGEIHSDALHQQAVGSQLGVLPAGDVAVALADQNSHLLHDGASVHVVTQSLVDGKLPVVETTQHQTPLAFCGQCDCYKST